MKKLLCILIALTMLLGLAACGAPAAPPAKTVEATAAPTEEIAPVQEPTPEPTPEPEVIEVEDLIGEKDDHSYENRTFGIRAQFPADWTILDEEQTAQVMGLAADITSNEDLAEQFKQAGSLCDLYAVSMQGDNVNIMVEDLGKLYGILLTEERYAQIAAPQLESGLSSMGITDISYVTESCSFAGQDRFSLFVTSNYNGVPVYERIVLIKVGNYMVPITFTSLDESRLNAALDFFAPIDG